MLLPRKDRELQDAIGLRFRIVQVTERRSNGPDRLRTEARPKLFLVKPGMDLKMRTQERARRGVRPAPRLQKIEPPKTFTNVIQMPSLEPARRENRRFGTAAVMGPLAWLGHALLSLVRFR